MNKLTSKNPILRFKLGNKVKKFQLGGWAGYYTVGNWPKSGGNVTEITTPKVAPIQKLIPKNGTYYEKTIGGKVIERGRWQNGKQVPILDITIDGGQLPEVIVTEKRKVVTPVKKSSNKTLNNSTNLSFKIAFNKARNAGLETFNWNGKSYTTRNKGEENYVFLNGKWINPVNNISFLAPSLSETNKEIINVPLTAEYLTLTVPTINVPQQTFNRSQIRLVLRNKGFNPYQFSGAERRALRMVMNGLGTDTDRAIVSGMGILKKGGNLVSKNAIKRFKQKY